MNVDTGALYYGAREIEAALLRGEDLVRVGPDIADGSASVNVWARFNAQQLGRAHEEELAGSPLTTVRFGPDCLVAPPPAVEGIHVPAHQLAAAMAKQLR